MMGTTGHHAFPARPDFREICRNTPLMIPPLYTELPFKSPAAVFEIFKDQRAVLLLESVKGPEKIARYSFIVFNPFLELIVKDQVLQVVKDNRRSILTARPLTRLREILGAYPQRRLVQLPPFQGGAVGLISYDFVHYIERLPRRCLDDLRIPDAHFYIVDSLFAFDHKLNRAYAVVAPGARQMELGYSSLEEAFMKGEPNLIYDEAEERLQRMAELYRSAPAEMETLLPVKKKRLSIVHEMKQSQYMDMVRRAKDYIRAGDIFQANLSQRLSAHIGDTSPWQLYKILRSINPSPFSFYADFGEYQLVSSSPERLIKLSDRVAQTRPIAGTRPRGISPEFDERMRADLLLNEKERAEHIMLIDLERNDLGKVCDYGTVVVDELMITEDYSHVIHIVSNVRGRLAEGRDAMSLIRAVFPGGTITGVPKVRCMEIIDELEPVARGPYTGSFGYISFSGDMDLNIIIRTMVVKDSVSYVQAGAGIVADSDPEREYFETLRKAEALLSTLERV